MMRQVLVYNVHCNRCRYQLFSLFRRFSSNSNQEKTTEVLQPVETSSKPEIISPSKHNLPEKYEPPKEESVIKHSRTEIFAQIEADKKIKVPFRLWQIAIKKTYIPHQAYLDLTIKERNVYEQHMAAVQKRQLTYKDPETNNEVMTVTALLLQEKCCGNACRHCPYEHENVPPDKRHKKVFNGAYYL